ncbi:hypothetical protein SAMN04489859_10835 [Paracoccus alcaliphilus]|uniref:Uncharacterized protein n=1 Tax=Paracoccus alcaliphilus TaxID=34002 RepID=A0A1H8P736_9RHOB|nr:GIY-YIG nuclease family protein [Paracoccus alcaliphilus]SEO37749.1 hypothetical protein SAMN04489859_10835 [Paracoccus alcaliphilus]
MNLNSHRPRRQSPVLQNRTIIPNDMVTSHPEQFSFYPGAIHAHWHATANAKGFDITGRILDRYHLALRCHACSHVHASRIYTVMSVQPQCPACMLARLQRDAEAAGVTHLRRDPEHRQYSFYRASCGHDVRRQHEIIRRVAAGVTDLRCETCHAATEAREARKRGWMLVGPDPEGDPNYRLYAHADGCGAQQRIARVNMRTGRFECSCCGEGWAASRSYLYAMSFTLANGRDLVKLGYSRDPESRLLHQLRIARTMPCEILRVVEMASGHQAIRTEKGLHTELRETHPDAVVDPLLYRGQIRVRSEIYDATLTPLILSMLDGIETQAAAA